MNSSTSNISSRTIFDLPNEILAEILLLLNARERVAFANSSPKFHSLVFQDKQLLRNLDFSEEGRLTSLSDIEEYIKHKRTGRHILKLNLANVTCISPSEMMIYFLCKAKNLVDINIQGIEFKNIVDFAFFLLPLTRLKRLTIDWPRTTRLDIERCRALLSISFARLRYLSVRMRWTNFSPEFIASLHLCEKLEELRIFQICLPVDNYEDIRGIVKYKQLKSLKILEYCGHGAIEVLDHISFLFTDPREWIRFVIDPDFPFAGFYFEKGVEVCDKLANPVYFIPCMYICMYPFSDCLLTQAIMKTHANPPQNFCCLPEPNDVLPFLMKIEEMKLLLKDPGYQIQYLNISHTIEADCDVHLVASVFQTLTELVLTNIVKKKEQTSQRLHPKKRLQKIDSVDSDNLWNRNKDSSFKMLVENTPHLRKLTLNANPSIIHNGDEWDLEALCLISRWSNLRSLSLKSIPITDGEFLIEIGKACVRLEKLEFQNLGPLDSCAYIDELPQMLSHCKNLIGFTLQQTNLLQISKVLLLLDNNRDLKKVWVKSCAQNESAENLISSIEHLLQQCPRLNTLFCVVDGMTKKSVKELTLALRRLKIEMNRPTLQFQVVDDDNAEDLVLEDYSSPAFPWNLERFNEI